MRVTKWICLLTMLAGCSREAPPKPPIAPVASTFADPTGKGLGPGQRAPVEPNLYEGRTAQEWATELKGPDAAQSAEAVLALRELGEEGYQHLFQGMQSSIAEIRLLSLQAIYQPVLVAHRDEMLPLLFRLLQDADPRIRQSAAVRLSGFGTSAKAGAAILRKMSTSDPDRSVRLAALESAMIVEGVKPVYSEDLK